MRVGIFQGIPTIQEVSCSGQALASDSSVFSMSLYAERRLLAQVNVMNKECTTSGTFSSCLVHQRDSRSTELRTLVMDLGQNETREFTCELVNQKSGEKAKTDTWSLVIEGRRE
ncbi:hypothetical protein BaRGS_00018451 [Batillaria attramentaria]|uniref:Uncharacterized protein n=1 Tax=Batillaria attramentaria TaxID=370345 RepID=A0ABD0KSV9_9CAEN|nr:hypothetical protein BaRGS_015734 [Batillaria attramentaria]